MQDKLIKARLLFNDAHRTKSVCEELISFSANDQHIIIRAYNSAATMVFSKFHLNPFISMKYFNNGKKLLEELIQQNPSETELFYLRYTLQRNAPKFIGYYKNLHEDGAILAAYLRKNPESALSKHIMIYLNDTKDELLGVI